MYYTKDLKPYTLNYSDVFGEVTETSIALINSCQYIYRDNKGQYLKVAVSFDGEGNVFFEKQYINE